MSHLGTGGDSYRPTPSGEAGGIRYEGDGERTAPTLPRPLNVTDHADEFADTVRHEAAHGACAYALGWTVHYVDARTGKTEVTPPPLLSQTLAEKDLQHAVIAASAKAFTGSYRDRPFEDDRFQVRRRGHIDFGAAQKKAERLAADPWPKAIYNRLIAALLIHGRLEGDKLAAVLAGD